MSKRVDRFEVGRRYRIRETEFTPIRVSDDGLKAWVSPDTSAFPDWPWELPDRSIEELGPVLRVQSASGSLPRYATPGSSGLDLESAIDVELAPRTRGIIPTGLSLEIPAGYEGQIRPRSGLTAKTSITVHLGTIDSDYRGQVGVIVENCGAAPYQISKGQRIAQLVIAPVARVEVVLVDSLGGTDRGEGGFGSTGQ